MDGWREKEAKEKKEKKKMTGHLLVPFIKIKLLGGFMKSYVYVEFIIHEKHWLFYLLFCSKATGELS